MRTTNGGGSKPYTTEVRSHADCLLHRPPAGHPETPARLEAVLAALVAPVERSWQVVRSSPAPSDNDVVGMLAWIHDRSHIERVRGAAEAGTPWLDSHDCVVSSGTWRSALTAAALTLETALELVNGRLERAFLAVRPPSHHAERDRARGYCFFNSVALAAEVVVRSWGEPVLIVDIDAFHGNGTQRHFYDRSDVGYLSIHRYPGFPGSGGADEIGEGAGRGTTRNVPLAVGADDAVFCTALEHGLEELGPRLRPAALVVSAGFSALAGDPLGGMRVSVAGFRRMTAALVQAAETWAGGRLLSVLEGGFDPLGLAIAARAHVEELAAVEPGDAGGGSGVN